MHTTVLCGVFLLRRFGVPGDFVAEQAFSKMVTVRLRSRGYSNRCTLLLRFFKNSTVVRGRAYVPACCTIPTKVSLKPAALRRVCCANSFVSSCPFRVHFMKPLLQHNVRGVFLAASCLDSRLRCQHVDNDISPTMNVPARSIADATFHHKEDLSTRM